MYSGLWSVLGRVQQIETALRGLAPQPRATEPAESFTDALSRVRQQVVPAANASRNLPAALYGDLIQQAASRYGVDPDLIHAIIRAESGYDPQARSRAGAAGLMQLMPGTARRLGVDDPYDPVQSIDAGTRFMGELLDLFPDSLESALAAYNAGPGAVRRYGGIPPYAETQAYVPRVLGYLYERKLEGSE